MTKPTKDLTRQAQPISMADSLFARWLKAQPPVKAQPAQPIKAG